MKKFFILVFLLSLASCNQKSGDAVKGETSLEKTLEKASNYTYHPLSISLQWTAYKTTKKDPVSGTFQKIHWKNLKSAQNPENTVENLYFKIDASSVFTNNSTRDQTIYEYLYGKMLEGNYIEGRTEKIMPEKQTIRMVIRMNGVEKQTDFTYTLNDSILHAVATIDLEKEFNAGEALYFLHTACKDKHTGEDGISKTWPEVKLEAFVRFEKIND